MQAQFVSQQKPTKQPLDSVQLNKLSDDDILIRTQRLVQKERELVTAILHHLTEVERRKLYSDLGYKSLFDYAVKELGYSEGQAGRRLQAMRLLSELPQEEKKEVELKIESGALNLTTICQAQSFFNEIKKATPENGFNFEQKLEVLRELEHKTVRQGQVVLLQKMESSGGGIPLPKEKERWLSAEHSELRLVIGAELRNKMDEVRALLGPKAIGLSWAELIEEMARLSLDALKDKKFGKRRHLNMTLSSNLSEPSSPAGASARGDALARGTAPTTETAFGAPAQTSLKAGVKEKVTPAPYKEGVKKNGVRSLSKSKRHRIWQRDGGACVKCGAKAALHVDHIIPVALGGSCEEQNLRLLCFNCNVREGIRHFGMEKMKRTIIQR